MRHYCIETYGCQMNVADSELIAGILEDDGWVRATDAHGADLIVVNTCSVRERAADRVVGHVRSLAPLRRARPGLRIVVAGCLPQHLGERLAERLPDVDLFIGPDAYRRLPELVADPSREPHFALARDRGETYEDLSPLRAEGIHAYVSIMRGCDRACTYCAVPFGRGRERSLPAEAAIRATREAVESGFVAVTLLGQAVTSYREGERDFAALLEALAVIPGLCSLRFLAPHPGDVSVRLLEVMRRHPVIAHHLHLPLQAGSDRILTAMRRGYTAAEFVDLVARARRTLPEISITTDIIVGFPGESDEDYTRTVEVMETVRFDSAFTFAYSPREETYAQRFLADDVPPEVKQRRLSAVITLQERHSLERYQARIGTTQEVLVEGPAKGTPDRLFGRCSDMKAAVFSPGEAEEIRAGEIARVEITAASSHTLKGVRRR
jgi:tRNA-2-methylthio-N6-dimethylallyladenosine synthase